VDTVVFLMRECMNARMHECKKKGTVLFLNKVNELKTKQIFTERERFLLSGDD